MDGSKIMSGRWLTTVILTLTIAYMLINSIDLPEWLVALYSSNVVLYYYRSDRT